MKITAIASIVLLAIAFSVVQVHLVDASKARQTSPEKVAIDSNGQPSSSLAESQSSFLEIPSIKKPSSRRSKTVSISPALSPMQNEQTSSPGLQVASSNSFNGEESKSTLKSSGLYSSKSNPDGQLKSKKSRSMKVRTTAPGPKISSDMNDLHMPRSILKKTQSTLSGKDIPPPMDLSQSMVLPPRLRRTETSTGMGTMASSMSFTSPGQHELKSKSTSSKEKLSKSSKSSRSATDKKRRNTHSMAKTSTTSSIYDDGLDPIPEKMEKPDPLFTSTVPSSSSSSSSSPPPVIIEYYDPPEEENEEAPGNKEANRRPSFFRKSIQNGLGLFRKKKKPAKVDDDDEEEEKVSVENDGPVQYPNVLYGEPISARHVIWFDNAINWLYQGSPLLS